MILILTALVTACGQNDINYGSNDSLNTVEINESLEPLTEEESGDMLEEKTHKKASFDFIKGVFLV